MCWCQEFLPSQARELAHDEPKPVYKIGFVREKGKATAREALQSPEASGSTYSFFMAFIIKGR
jgi:hypothetical protein